MDMKEQFKKLKENWLLLAIILGILVVPGLLRPIAYGGVSSSFEAGDAMYGKSYGSRNSMQNIYDDRNFAPDEEDRKIVKTVSMSTEVKRGTYKDEETRLKAIVSSSSSFIINENVNNYGEKPNNYYTGYYTIKVPAPKYDDVLTQLKGIGEVKSFVESKDDITGSYTDLTIELEVEQERLKRYEGMFAEADLVADKITLNDRIFEQERKIKYMEDQITNMDETVDYSTVSFSMTEAQSDYANIVFVKFAELVRVVVGSFNAMLYFVAGVLPWALGAGLVILIVNLIKRKK